MSRKSNKSIFGFPFVYPQEFADGCDQKESRNIDHSDESEKNFQHPLESMNNAIQFEIDGIWVDSECPIDRRRSTDRRICDRRASVERRKMDRRRERIFKLTKNR